MYIKYIKEQYKLKVAERNALIRRLELEAIAKEEELKKRAAKSQVEEEETDKKSEKEMNEPIV